MSATRTIIATLVVLTVAATSWVLPAVAQTDVATTTVQGKVVNGTDGAQLPEDLEVFLLVIDETQESIIERVSTTIDEDGRFAVEAPVLNEGQFYRIVADDGIYTPYKDIVDLSSDPEPVLTVFDRTTSLDQISIGTYSVVVPVIDPATQTVSVLAAISLNNNGDEVFVADLADPALTGFKLLRFNLPEGYGALNVESDLPSGNVMEISTGFALSNPVPPGEWNLVVSYSAPYDESGWEYPFRLPFGADRVFFMVPEGEGTVSGLGLAGGETSVINETSYAQYEGTDYARGSQLDVIVTNLPSPGIGGQLGEFLASTQFQVALAATVGLLLVGGLAGYLILRAPSSGTTAPVPVSGNESATTRSSIVAAIAELDRRHESGDLDEATYHAQRRQLVDSALKADE